MATAAPDQRPKIIHLVRHAQGLHNLPPDQFPPSDELPPNIEITEAQRHDPNTIRDPPLTQQGATDCTLLKSSFPHHANIDLLCASPMRRGIQTARCVFDPVIKRGLKVLLLPDAQEAWGDLASTGSSLEELHHEFDDPADLDFSLVHAGWELKQGANGIDPPNLMARAKRLLNWLDAREEGEIVLVGHGYFFQYLHGGVDETGSQMGRNWRNLEFRSYHLVRRSGDEVARLEQVDLRTKRSFELLN